MNDVQTGGDTKAKDWDDRLRDGGAQNFQSYKDVICGLSPSSGLPSVPELTSLLSGGQTVSQRNEVDNIRCGDVIIGGGGFGVGARAVPAEEEGQGGRLRRRQHRGGLQGQVSERGQRLLAFGPGADERTHATYTYV